MKIKQLFGCARCGKDHSDLAFVEFDRPFAPKEAGGLTWTHWTSCPQSGDPILLMFDAKQT